MSNFLGYISIYFITFIITYFIVNKIYVLIVKIPNKQIVISVIIIIIVINFILIFLGGMYSNFTRYSIAIFKAIPMSTALATGILIKKRNSGTKPL